MNKIVWLDAQLSPILSEWIGKEFGVTCIHVKSLGLSTATDKQIFSDAKRNNVIVITKDSDFQDLLIAQSSPPKVIWLTCGNTSNAKLKEIFRLRLSEALRMLEGENDLVEITG